VDERLEIHETRIAEQAQTKIESSQKLPIRVTGMALFNAYVNTGAAGEAQYPTIAAPGARASGGGSFRQTILGLEYRGPEVFGGGRLGGELHMDFFGGSGRILDQGLRIRTATVRLDWRDRSIVAGLEKPVFSPREPLSLAQVGVSPLTGAGNLWLWIPQVRFEQTFRAGETAGLRAQIGAVQTREVESAIVAPGSGYDGPIGQSRPGIEGRFEFFAGAEGRRLEIAPGFHRSVSHVGPASVPSNVVSLDWLARPWRPIEFTGMLFTGQNVSHLGTGGIRQGYAAGYRGYGVRAVRSRGGWGQLSAQVTPRLTFTGFSGVHDDRNRDLPAAGIGRNLAWGANALYRIAPNVLAGFEAARVRTSYIGGAAQTNNHYDLALAYLF
jgi:hypothetical protein